MVCLNLIPEVVGAGDPDEILVLRRSPDGARLVPRVYRIPMYEPTPVEFRLEPLSDDGNARVVAGVLPDELLDSRTVVGVLGQRRESVLYLDHSRPVDCLVAILSDPSRLGFVEGGDVVYVDAPPMVAPVMLDIDLDRTDELCYIEPKKRRTVLKVCDLRRELREVTSIPIDAPARGVSRPGLKAFGLRCSVQVSSKPAAGR